MVQPFLPFRLRIGSLLLLTGITLASALACSDEDDGPVPDHSHGGAPPEEEEPPVPDVASFTEGSLAFTIDSVKVSKTGKAEVEFSIADGAGKPLDLDGSLTQGAVSPSFILSWLGETEDGESAQYTAYTTRTKVSKVNGEEAVQSSTDQGGKYEKLALGKYRYTFATKIDINDARSKLTHTLGAYATRTFDGVRYVASALHSWVPDGSEVTTEQDVVTDAACNSCHTRLEFHGGSRRGVGMCNLCHTDSNSINPETGNTFDFQVMIHKIHMGANLPSVVAGDPYTFVGYMDHVEDFSGVQYPWDMRDCGKCHQGTQGERWLTRPTVKPCASCHDRTYFGTGEPPEGWTRHTAGPRDDSECHVCHGEDSLEPITKSHVTSITDASRPKVSAEIIAITDTDPGETPSVELEFTLDGSPHDILDEPFDRIRMRIWGPTTDVTDGWSETISEAPVCADPVVLPCIVKAGTRFIYHAAVPIPPTAAGSYLVGLDGRYVSMTHGNVAFSNVIKPFAVTEDLVERRAIVSREKCNSCHGDMAFHGGSYTEPLYCLNCHNTTSYAGPEDDLMPGDTAALASINLKDFIHRIHAGASYPAPLNDCQQCHLEGTYSLPLAHAGLQSSAHARVTCDADATECLPEEMEGMGGVAPSPTTETLLATQPEGAACVSCHSGASTQAHIETNSAVSGEACGTCHGTGKTYAVGPAHALAP